MERYAKKITIYDIAKTAGVSKTTVSRFLNGKFEYMSADTRKRIENVIAITNFKPNNIARSLKSNATKLIGLVVADIESPFISSMIKSVGDTLIASGYNTIIVNTDNDYEKEKNYINMLISQRVDGLIINTAREANPFVIDLANKGMPIVLADRFLRNHNFDISYVECENSMREALNHLTDEGYGKIFLLTQKYEEVSPRLMRVNAFLNYLKEKNIENPESFVKVIDLEADTPALEPLRTIKEYSRGDKKPPAIIAANGTTLMHVINAVRKLEISMPKELGVCGYDDWGFLSGSGYTSMIENGITALITSPKTVGTNAANLLLRRIKDPEGEKVHISCEAKLAVRNSTKL